MTVRTPLREIRLRIVACLAIISLSFDSLNPVKLLCTASGIPTLWVGIAATGFIVSAILSNSVIGKQNIPTHGPIIFTGNHMNQFVDAVILIITNPLNVGFLIAEKSFKKPIIGDFARAAGAIPVARPQDCAKKGTGKVMLEGLKLHGEGTTFTALGKGDKIRPGKTPNVYRCKTVYSDTEVLLAEEVGEPSATTEPQGVWMGYEVLGFIDQSKMFSAVEKSLSQGHTLGIFPEGGSHDRTDLLPLKAGVAAIAFGVREKYDISVPIIPVGLNYFRGHRFGGRVVVEFGAPVNVSKETWQLYQTSKRGGYQKLLGEVEEGMRSVIVTAPNYAELKLIHVTRRLYQGSAASPRDAIKEKQDMARRFSLACQLLKEKYGVDANWKNAEGKLPQELLALKVKIEKYQELLEYWGLLDYQVNRLDIPFQTKLYTYLHMALVILLSSIPTLLLNAPVAILASYWANLEAKKEIKTSGTGVKLAARDVIMSKKVLFSLVAVPSLWLTYALLLMVFTDWQYQTILMLVLCCPFFSYIGVMTWGAGIVDFRDIRPVFLRLLPAFREVAATLPEKRNNLQKEVRSMVDKYGPMLGGVYSDQSDGWEKRCRGGANHWEQSKTLTEGDHEHDHYHEHESEDKHYEFAAGLYAPLPPTEDAGQTTGDTGPASLVPDSKKSKKGKKNI